MSKELIEKVAPLIGENAVTPYQGANLIIPVIREEIQKELEEYICDDCSTPNFVHIVVPKDYWGKF